MKKKIAEKERLENSLLEKDSPKEGLPPKESLVSSSVEITKDYLPRLRIQKREGGVISLLYLDIRLFELHETGKCLRLIHPAMIVEIRGTRLRLLESYLSRHLVRSIIEDPSPREFIDPEDIHIHSIMIQKNGE